METAVSSRGDKQDRSSGCSVSGINFSASLAPGLAALALKAVRGAGIGLQPGVTEVSAESSKLSIFIHVHPFSPELPSHPVWDMMRPSSPCSTVGPCCSFTLNRAVYI